MRVVAIDVGYPVRRHVRHADPIAQLDERLHERTVLGAQVMLQFEIKTAGKQIAQLRCDAQRFGIFARA